MSSVEDRDRDFKTFLKVFIADEWEGNSGFSVLLHAAYIS